MTLKTTIDREIKEAMLKKNKVRLMALRSIKSLILLAEKAPKTGPELSTETEINLLTKAAKQRRDSIEIFEKGGRMELAEKEKNELKVIMEFLPKPLDKNQIRTEITNIINEIGAKDMKDMGKVMNIANKKLAGKAESKLMSEIVKQILNQPR